jgi:hypothetical protein
MEHRRRTSRQGAGWPGICHLEGDSVPGGRDCWIIDISMLGLGITLHYFWPSELVGQSISVDVPAVGDSVNIRLEGVIKNAEPTPGGVVRVGIEFVGLSNAELTIATVLGTMIHDAAGDSVPSPAVAVSTSRQDRIEVPRGDPTPVDGGPEGVRTDRPARERPHLLRWRRRPHDRRQEAVA